MDWLIELYKGGRIKAGYRLSNLPIQPVGVEDFICQIQMKQNLIQ